MHLKTTKQIAQEIADKKNEEEKQLGLPSDWTAETVISEEVRQMHGRVFGK